MYTHCPHCDTFFRVTSEQLKSAQGSVRCGRCYGTFNALENLADEPPKLKTTPPETSQDLAEETKTQIQNETMPQPVSPEITITKKTTTDHSLKREHSQQLIDEMQTPSSISQFNSRRLLWLLLAIPLLFLLTVQYAYFNIKSLSQDADLRPSLSLMCGLLGCELPLQSTPRMIKLAERDIRAHPSKKGILLVKAVMINNAPYRQTFPTMQLSMQDINGRTISGRRFLPDEYLSDKTIDTAAGIPPKHTIKVELQLLDPGKEAVGFEFDFF